MLIFGDFNPIVRFCIYRRLMWDVSRVRFGLLCYWLGRCIVGRKIRMKLLRVCGLMRMLMFGLRLQYSSPESPTTGDFSVSLLGFSFTYPSFFPAFSLAFFFTLFPKVRGTDSRISSPAHQRQCK